MFGSNLTMLDCMAAVHHKLPVSSPMKLRSRELRQHQTHAEKAMWRLLRDRQLNDAKFRRQHVVGNYILDFYCHAAKLAVELDGSQHAEIEKLAYDADRSAVLADQGIRVLRFWNNEVLANPQGVLMHDSRCSCSAAA